MSKKDTYRKDIFGDIESNNDQETPLIPAATIILLRTKAQKMEVLMLQRNKGIAFSGMWVFPGGKIDQSDYQNTDGVFDAALNAAIRETKEETNISLDGNQFIWLSHWTPPKSTPKRFSTWFFLAEIDFDSKVRVDGEEILNHRWVTPVEAMALQAKGEIELAPPTWITLHQLSLRSSVQDAIAHFNQSNEYIFKTRLALNESGIPLAIWKGDSAYESGDVKTPGPRHRLVLEKSGFKFENDVIQY
ncbi:MAG: NUDIX hydrolase [Pseudomonadales bacterium]|nr:NUDIX hydrolase [Pseudomonadales bacterium]